MRGIVHYPRKGANSGGRRIKKDKSTCILHSGAWVCANCVLSSTGRCWNWNQLWRGTQIIQTFLFTTCYMEILYSGESNFTFSKTLFDIAAYWGCFWNGMALSGKQRWESVKISWNFIIEGMAYRSKFFFPIGGEGKTNFMLGPTQTGMGVGPYAQRCSPKRVFHSSQR